MLPLLGLLFAGCSSGMMTYQNPIVKKGGEYAAAIMYSNTESLEAQGTLGLGYDVDMSIKFCPLSIISTLWKGENWVPFDLNFKYQVMSKPLYIAAGAGGSRLVLTGGEVGQKLPHPTFRTSSMSRIFVLAGLENIYCGYQLNYVSYDRPAIQFGTQYQYEIPTNRLVGSYIFGASIGKSIRLNPEVHLIPSDSGLQILWGIGLEYSQQ